MPHQKRKGRDGINVWIAWPTYDKVKLLAAYAVQHPEGRFPKSHAGIVDLAVSQLINKRHLNKRKDSDNSATDIGHE